MPSCRACLCVSGEKKCLGGGGGVLSKASDNESFHDRSFPWTPEISQVSPSGERPEPGMFWNEAYNHMHQTLLTAPLGFGRTLRYQLVTWVWVRIGSLSL